MKKFFIPVYIKDNQLFAFCRWAVGEQNYHDRTVLLNFIRSFVDHQFTLRNKVNNFQTQIFFEHRSDKRFYIWQGDREDQFCDSLSNKEGLDFIENEKLLINIPITSDIGNIAKSEANFCSYDSDE